MLCGAWRLAADRGDVGAKRERVEVHPRGAGQKYFPLADRDWVSHARANASTVRREGV